MHGAVIRRLSDDDPLVICAVLSGKAVQTLAPAELVPEIKALLARSRAAYTASSETKSKKKLFRGLIKQVFCEALQEMSTCHYSMMTSLQSEPFLAPAS